MKHLVICGSSTRAAAESAARAGFAVTAIDAFADRDQHPAVRAMSVSTDGAPAPNASALARTAAGMRCDAAAYLSPLENHPSAVARIAAGRVLLGNPPATLRAVRDPFRLADVVRRYGFTFPRIRRSNDPNDSNAPNDFWLLKPFRSGGGNRIRHWNGDPIPRTSYLQERIGGTPASLVFVAAGGRCAPIGLSRQLSGDPVFGASGFRYCGNILASVDDPQFERGGELLDAAVRLARIVTSAFGLVGLNGVDFLARGSIPVLLEVNPRWSSSVELAERAFGRSFFQAHVDACAGVVPTFDLASHLQRTRAFGKAIVYAREDGYVIDTARWLDDPDVRDVPRGGQRFRAGQPVCSVFASAADSASCYRALVALAARVYRQLEHDSARSVTAGR